jgi:hypothetical protein
MTYDIQVHDRWEFASLTAASQHFELNGYYGGLRLLKATVNKFVALCNDDAATTVAASQVGIYLEYSHPT